MEWSLLTGYHLNDFQNNKRQKWIKLYLEQCPAHAKLTFPHLPSSRYSRLFSNPKSDGIVPVNSLIPAEITRQNSAWVQIHFKSPKPTRYWFCSAWNEETEFSNSRRSKNVRVVSRPSMDGMVPINWLPSINEIQNIKRQMNKIGRGRMSGTRETNSPSLTKVEISEHSQ